MSFCMGFDFLICGFLHMRDNGGEKPMAAKSVRNIHGILTKCLSTAAKVGYIKSNPASMATLPRVEKNFAHLQTSR